MQRLINDLLAFSRVGRNTSAFEPVDLNEMGRAALENLAAPLAKTNAKVTIAQLPVVDGEPSLLLALFQNLLGNALKFSREDKDAQVDVSVIDDGTAWRFEVADDGIGIDPTYAQRIFVIFQRLHGRDEYGGTGIGLALCKKIVEYHGGQIWLDENVERGTKFIFTLPFREGTPAR